MWAPAAPKLNDTDIDTDKPARLAGDVSTSWDMGTIEPPFRPSPDAASHDMLEPGLPAARNTELTPALQTFYGPMREMRRIKQVEAAGGWLAGW